MHYDRDKMCIVTNDSYNVLQDLGNAALDCCCNDPVGVFLYFNMQRNSGEYRLQVSCDKCTGASSMLLGLYLVYRPSSYINTTNFEKIYDHDKHTIYLDIDGLTQILPISMDKGKDIFFNTVRIFLTQCSATPRGIVADCGLFSAVNYIHLIDVLDTVLSKPLAENEVIGCSGELMTRFPSFSAKFEFKYGKASLINIPSKCTYVFKLDITSISDATEIARAIYLKGDKLNECRGLSFSCADINRCKWNFEKLDFHRTRSNKLYPRRFILTVRLNEEVLRKRSGDKFYTNILNYVVERTVALGKEIVYDYDQILKDMDVLDSDREDDDNDLFE